MIEGNPSISTLRFIDRFTAAEIGAIFRKASEDDNIAKLYTMLVASDTVKFNDPRLSPGLTYAVSLGLLTAERKIEILTP